MRFPQRRAPEGHDGGRAPGVRQVAVSRGATPTSVAPWREQRRLKRQTSQCSHSRSSRTVSARSIERRKPHYVAQPWDDSITDLNQCKLDPAMDLRRRMNRISKHKEDAGALFHERLREMERDVRPFLAKTQPQKPSAVFASKVPTGRAPIRPDRTKGPSDVRPSTDPNSVSSKNAVQTLMSLSDFATGLAVLDDLPAGSSLCPDSEDIAWGDVEEVGEEIARLMAAPSWLRQSPYNTFHADVHDAGSTNSSLAGNSPRRVAADSKNGMRTNGHLLLQQTAHRPTVASERTKPSFASTGLAPLGSTRNAATIPTPCRARARLAAKHAATCDSSPLRSEPEISLASSSFAACLPKSDTAFTAAEEGKHRLAAPPFGICGTEENDAKDWHSTRRTNAPAEGAPAPTFRAQCSPHLTACTGANEKMESHRALSSAKNAGLFNMPRAIGGDRLLSKQCSDEPENAPRGDVQFGNAFSGPLSDLIDRQAEDLRQMLQP